MSVQQRRKYDPDIKRNAVLLSEEESKTVVEVADNLGISKDLIYRWRREYRSREELAFPGHGRESLNQKERKIRELERRSATDAMKKAIIRRWPGEGLMIHGDRGVQYESSDFKAVLQKHKFIQSMSRKGNYWDNPVAESFFHTIKSQFIHHCLFQTVGEAEQAIFEYIKVYYNRRRKKLNEWLQIFRRI